LGFLTIELIAMLIDAAILLITQYLYAAIMPLKW